MLTNTDLQVLALTPFLTNNGIGKALEMGRTTVRWHLQKCYTTLNVPEKKGEYRRMVAVILALRRGLLSWEYMAGIEKQLEET